MDWFKDLFIDEAKAALDSRNTSSGSESVIEEDWIGDGNTHIWVTLGEGRTSPMIGVCPNGTVTVDWGDGTAPYILTGTSTTTTKWTSNHEYAEPGDYVITLVVDGSIGFIGYNGNNSSRVLRNNPSYDTLINTGYDNSIIKVEFGEKIFSIGEYAFSRCYSLQSVNIPNSVTNIGYYTFNECYSLKSVNIPNSVTSIGGSAFNKCYSLQSVNIPNSVTNIGNNAFNACYSLRSVNIPNSVTNIGYYTFNACYSLQSVNIPNSVTSIGSNAFSACYSLQSVNIPNSVTSIGSNAFSSCYSLTSINIPNSVTSIGSNAFTQCRSIHYCDFTKHTTVPTLYATPFHSNTPEDFEIRVPAALYDEWVGTINWSVSDTASKIVAV